VAARLAEAGLEPVLLESAPGRANVVARIGGAGAFTFHAGPGQRLYPIASAERGTAWLRLTARGRAGHGSKPNEANAVTRLAGAVARIGEAVGYVDGRVLPGGEDEFRATLDELTGPDVSWEYAHEETPLEAPPRAPVMARMARALLAEDPGSVIVPYCMSGGTDAKQFSRLGLTCYGFTPLVLPEGYDYYAMFHGTDERIPLSALEASVRIMDRFLAAADE